MNNTMEQNPDLVSVIIPCYNHGAYIHEAIQCILNQSYRNFEIIVVDDGSDDPATLETLKAIETPRTTVYHKENGHLSSARNFGIRKSKGAYVLPLDSDDKFAPTFIEQALRMLRNNPRIGAVTCYVKRFGTARDRPFLPKGGSVSDFLVQNNSCGNALFRRQCWVDAGGYDEGLRGFEDWDFWIGVTKKGWLVHSIPEFLFFYRDTPQSMLKTVEQQRPELTRKIVLHHAEVYREHVADVIYQKELEIRSLRNRVRELKAVRKRSPACQLRRILRVLLRRFRKTASTGTAAEPSYTRPLE